MKVIERRNITSKVDGEYLLQMEDWSEDYPSVHAYADQLAAYPIAKGSVYKGYYNYAYPRRGEKFRLGMKFTSTVQAQKAMNEDTQGFCQYLRHDAEPDPQADLRMPLIRKSVGRREAL